MQTFIFVVKSCFTIVSVRGVELWGQLGGSALTLYTPPSCQPLITPQKILGDRPLRVDSLGRREEITVRYEDYVFGNDKRNCKTLTSET